ncbi:MAG: hypothetical protein ABIH20_04970 [Candidatus Diapherotrites archaeon]
MVKHTVESAIERLAEFIVHNREPSGKEWATLWPPIMEATGRKIHIGELSPYFTLGNYKRVISPPIMLEHAYKKGLVKNPKHEEILLKIELFHLMNNHNLQIPHQSNQQATRQINNLFVNTPKHERVKLFGVSDKEVDNAVKVLAKIKAAEQKGEKVPRLKSRLDGMVSAMALKSREHIRVLVDKIRQGKVRIEREKPRPMPRRRR